MLQMQPEEEVSFGIHLIDKNEGPSLIIPPNIANQVIYKERNWIFSSQEAKVGHFGGMKKN